MRSPCCNAESFIRMGPGGDWYCLECYQIWGDEFGLARPYHEPPVSNVE